MADEKRVKLGVDIGELSNQLVQINNIIEHNYQKALQGQSEYNRILEESLQLLQRQVDLVGQLGQQNQMGPSTFTTQSEPIGGGDDDKLSTYENRYKLFIENTIPVIEYFRKNYEDRFYEISNNGSIDETYNQIDRIMDGD